MSPTSIFSLMVLGFTPAVPPLDLAAFGAPGCQGHINVFAGPSTTLFVLNLGATTIPFNVPVPLNTALYGVVMLAQGAADSPPSNPLGLKFSNGGRILVGL